MDIIRNKEKQPSIKEIEDYIDNLLFSTFYRTMIETYDPKISIEYRAILYSKGGI